jgi:hypothetical protein
MQLFFYTLDLLVAGPRERPELYVEIANELKPLYPKNRVRNGWAKFSRK